MLLVRALNVFWRLVLGPLHLPSVLQLLLQKVLWLMRRLKIDMHIRPLHIRQTLQFHLQLLRHIVTYSQTLLGIHHHIHLHHEPWTRVPCTYGVDLPYLFGMRHRDIRDELLRLGVGCDADQKLEFAVSGVQPQAGDENGEDDGAHGVDPPY